MTYTAPRAGRAEFPRSKTVSIKSFTRQFLSREWRKLGLRPIRNRPRKRGDCKDSPRPCPFLACRYHLSLDISECGSLKVNFPGLELKDLPATCALDVIDENPSGMTLEQVGQMLNVTRERIRQIEGIAAEKVEKRIAEIQRREHSTQTKEQR